MILIPILLSVLTWADPPVNWSYLSEIKDRHEFYIDDELIVKPKDSWQTLFSVVYMNLALNQMKDCVFFRVPGMNPGELKIKSILASDSCESHLLTKGDKEWKELKSLRFSTSSGHLTLEMTFPKYQMEKWKVEMQDRYVRPNPKMHLSSAEFRSSRIIMLAPGLISSQKVNTLLKSGTLCHEINEDCEEVKPSQCSQCSEGWYEVPNGCVQGPKYCGTKQCGLKNAPACRRGMKWQRTEKEFECRTDSSFAYCAKGLSIVCEGKLAFCR